MKPAAPRVSDSTSPECRAAAFGVSDAVAAYEAAEREGLGAVGLDGAMVDRPIYVRARALLQRSAAIEARCSAGPDVSSEAVDTSP